MTHKQRHLYWESCYNVRDLGGLPTTAGGETHWQAIIRSDVLSRLTPAGQQALLDYGVRTIIDLRGPQEVAAKPSPVTQPGTNDTAVLTYLNLPLEKYYPHVSALISQAATRAEVYIIILDHYPDAIADVMRAIAYARPGGVIIHCHAGKDRTGIVSALLLRLVGVPTDMVVADYAESQVRLWPLYEKMVAQAGGEENLGFWLKPTAVPAMMHHTLAHIETTYGSVQYYLQQAGLTPAEIKRLQNRLYPL